MVFDKLLNPIFDPLLTLDPLWIVLIISLIVSLLITVIYKLTTNQSLMKDLKAELKEFQKEMKELRDDPKKMMEVQKKAMQTNMKYMGHSMRATLFTFIPIILIFGWMNANVAYEPIYPGQEFTLEATMVEGATGNVSLIVPQGIEIIGAANKEIINNQVSWTLVGDEGDYIEGEDALRIDYKDQSEYKPLIISTKQHYAEPVKNVKKSSIKTIQIGNKEMKLLNIFGWKIGWLGTYIIFSIIFSIVTRKLMKVY